MTRNQSTDSLPIDAPERRRLPPLLRRCWYGLNQAFRRRILHTGVTPDQFTVLRTLIEKDGTPLTQRELAELISSDPNTIASLLDRMETSGLIARAEHEKDRRARRVTLLPTGRQMYQSIRATAVELQTEVLSVLPRDRREEFLEHLGLVADACRESAEKSPKGKKSPAPEVSLKELEVE